MGVFTALLVTSSILLLAWVIGERNAVFLPKTQKQPPFIWKDCMKRYNIMFITYKIFVIVLLAVCDFL
ncbi:hypothetical protein COE15_27855 [Bacillus cereus]|uniref:hypothetical protein n=1 Tax=unclassified Bacillus (in: firmicutes) TaxID=185979 RepID=UPI000559236E|nr:MULTISPECIES: hypothetical protein [unclassified Bacillus (in: firmicutes)]PFE03298.1 hypothetical protein CN288_13705 [Bacillus sp. AFS023182]PGX89548.1 hypothetical protein COE15_27855 [Bacillus cereus]